MRTQVEDPVPATALVVDLRGFTAELSRTHARPAERRRYTELLASMNAAVVESAVLALPPAARPTFALRVHVASTGDGALLVFLDPEGDGTHARAGFLASVLLRASLGTRCAAYADASGGEVSFGIGVESGTVSAVGAYPTGVGVPLATVIGGCINAAARVQDLTKVVHRTDVLLCSGLVERLTGDLFGQDYGALMQATVVPSGSLDDATYLALETRMVELNRELCVQFLHHHLIRGFNQPTALFRLSRSSAVPGNPRFEALLDRLCADDPSWRDEVREALAG